MELFGVEEDYLDLPKTWRVKLQRIARLIDYEERDISVHCAVEVALKRPDLAVSSDWIGLFPEIEQSFVHEIFALVEAIDLIVLEH